MPVITTLLVITYWLIACISNLIFSPDSSFYQEFFYPAPLELIRRITVVVFIITISMLFHYLSLRRKKHENILEEVLGLKPALLNIISSLVVVQDISGKIVRFNETSEAISGYDFSQVQNKYIWKFFSNPDEAKFIKEAFLKLDPLSFPQAYQSRLRTKDGRIKLIQWSNRIIFNSKAAPAYVVSTGHDLTSFLHSEEVERESEKEYKNIIDNIGIGISLVSKDTKRLYTNKQMAQWFPKRQALRHSISHDIISQKPVSSCDQCPSCKSLRDGMVHNAIVKTQRQGQDVSYKIVTFPIKDSKNEVVAAIEMVEDFTEMNLKEEEIRRSYLVQAVMNSLLRFSLENISLNDFLDCA
ncbi:MAG: PAS domain S-box protein, partial [Candidatus Omnitrophica bacterium]|nr:PAS domain S-box protein [Candidatus Omnitrophota bacterium]